MNLSSYRFSTLLTDAFHAAGWPVWVLLALATVAVLSAMHVYDQARRWSRIPFIPGSPREVQYLDVAGAATAARGARLLEIAGMVGTVTGFVMLFGGGIRQGEMALALLSTLVGLVGGTWVKELLEPINARIKDLNTPKSDTKQEEAA